MASIKLIVSFAMIIKNLKNINKFLGNLVGILICLKYFLIPKIK